jgi:hypothetical protein
LPSHKEKKALNSSVLWSFPLPKAEAMKDIHFTQLETDTNEENTMRKNRRYLLAAFVFVAVIATQAQTGQVRNRARDESVEQANLDAKQLYVVASPDATTTCTYPFSGGTGNKFISYCVTVNGNIVSFQSPAGHQYLATAPIGEGYSVCDFSSGKQYYDYAGYGSSGWQAATKVSSSATSVKIARTTTDGLYTLTQTITLNAGQSLAQITMALKNNDTTAHDVNLVRYADVDANGSTSNSFDYTQRTAFGYTPELDGFGLEMIDVSNSANTFVNGVYSQVIPGGPSCQFFTHVLGPLQSTDGSIFMEADMPTLAPKASGSYVTQYKSF